MNRTFRLSLFAFCLASPFAAVGAFAQTEADWSPVPAPWAAPVGHRQPTPSGLAPVAAPDALAPVLSGRSVGSGGASDIRGSGEMLIPTPRICSNCDD